MTSRTYSTPFVKWGDVCEAGVEEDLQYELQSATERLDQLEAMADRARKRLARQRQKLSGHRRDQVNPSAGIDVAIGHSGVVLQVADGTEKQLTTSAQGCFLGNA